jgi:hypothetical protein
MRSRLVAPLCVLVLALAPVLAACGSDEGAPAEQAAAPAPAPATSPSPAATAAPAAPPTPASLPRGLLLALSKFESGEDGKPIPRSELVVLLRKDGRWQATSYEDPASNVFHKAMVYEPRPGEPAILTIGGTAAALKLWRLREGALVPVETLWEVDFGGKFSRMRDAEAADLDGDGETELAVATHDQGVVAVVDPTADGFAVTEIDQQPDTFVHEIEIGDLDGDGVLEVYATPSEPNRLDGTPQHGEVVRYVPARGEGRAQVADLGTRHAKEILVGDVDGDGRDELYVSIEAAEGGELEVRRFDEGDAPDGGVTIATLRDPMARFLTAGDVDGDGAQELVVAAKDTGVWLLRPGDDPRARWRSELIDGESKGFEHAALLADLDEDGTDELYVASDDDRELRRYVFVDGGFTQETIYSRTDPLPVLTWNLMPVPVELVE